MITQIVHIIGNLETAARYSWKSAENLMQMSRKR